MTVKGSFREDLRIAADFAQMYPVQFAAEMERRMTYIGVADDERESRLFRYGVFTLGTNIFVRGIPFHYVGTFISIDGEKLGLWPCKFVRNTGPWTEALQEGKLDDRLFPGSMNDFMDVKGTGPVYVARITIHNVFRWPHPIV